MKSSDGQETVASPLLTLQSWLTPHLLEEGKHALWIAKTLCDNQAQVDVLEKGGGEHPAAVLQQPPDSCCGSWIEMQGGVLDWQAGQRSSQERQKGNRWKCQALMTAPLFDLPGSEFEQLPHFFAVACM